MNAQTQTDTNTATRLSERAMLAELSISRWTANRTDKEVTEEVHQKHGASNDAGKYRKALVSKEALAAVQAATSAARSAHYALTLPWSDSGPRILNAAAYLDYTAKMQRAREEFERAAQDFVSEYGRYVAEARARLGSLFDPNDYPDAAAIAGCFGFKVDILPMPDAQDFRADIGDEAAKALRQEIEQRTNETMARAMRDAWQRIAERVGHMAERLSAYNPEGKREGTFRDSLVENVRELVETLPALNVTGDPKLAEITERMRAELCTLDADQLRKNADARSDTIASARAILEEVSDYLA